MTQHLVSFTDHQSVSLEGGPAQDFFFFQFLLLCWRLWLTIPPLPPALAFNPHYLVIWLLLMSEYYGSQEKEATAFMQCFYAIQVEPSAEGAESSVSADHCGFLQR